jgi:hypothetical protein
MDHGEIGWEGVNCILLALDRDHVVVDMVMNLQVL